MGLYNTRVEAETAVEHELSALEREQEDLLTDLEALQEKLIEVLDGGGDFEDFRMCVAEIDDVESQLGRLGEIIKTTTREFIQLEEGF